MGNDVAESSRKGVKRSKKLHLAAVSISQQQGNEGIRFSEKGSNPSPDQQSNIQRMSPPRIPNEIPNEVLNEEQPVEMPVEENEVLRKRKRGPTRLRNICSSPADLLEVEFNERGQPIGKHSEWLSSFMGSLARHFVPVNRGTWRKVEKSVKEDMWTCVQGRFKIDDMHKNLLIQQMGTRWREGKSKLIASLRNASKLADKESKFASLKPDNLTLEEWNTFIDEKLSTEFEMKRQKYKDIRAKNHTPHTISRKGYARLEDDMKKANPEIPIRREDVWCKAHIKKNGDVPNAFVANHVSQIQEISSQTSHLTPLSINEDALSQTLGPERNGRVRGMGFGVTPSKLGVQMNSSKKVQALELELVNQKEKMKHLENEVGKVKNLENELKTMKQMLQVLASKEKANSNMSSPRFHSIGSRDNGSSNVRGCNGVNSKSTPTSANFGRKCKLLNWQRDVVAVAKIDSTDPNVLVHNVPLGKDLWKVWFLSAKIETAQLFKPNSEMSVIKDAVGTTTAWHKDFISFD